MTNIAWDQDSAHRLQKRLRGIEQLDLLVGGLVGLIREEREAYEDGVARLLQREPGDIRLGTSHCDASPTGKCVYEGAIGGDRRCLLCRNPQEL